MDRAINKTTDELVAAIKIGLDASYQIPKEDKWIAPQDSITNWDELDKKGIKEVATLTICLGETSI